MAILGLTGGIAAGKSTVARWLGERGAHVIDADQIAREVVEPGTPGLAQVVAHFGRGVLTGEGQLDRAALGRRVFGDGRALRDLNGLLHPLIIEKIDAALANAKDQRLAWVILDAALLFDMGLDDRCDAVLDIEASPATQIARLGQRNGLDPAQAQARIAAQWPADRRRALADWAIDNDGDLDSLKRQLEQVWAAIQARFAPATNGPRGR